MFLFLLVSLHCSRMTSRQVQTTLIVPLWTNCLDILCKVISSMEEAVFSLASQQIIAQVKHTFNKVYHEQGCNDPV